MALLLLAFLAPGAGLIAIGKVKQGGYSQSKNFVQTHDSLKSKMIAFCTKR
jgi:hypothetical protein